MSVSRAVRQALEAARVAGAEPTRAQRSPLSQSVTIAGRLVRLSGPDGRLTAAGKVWFAGGEPLLPFDVNQEPIQRGKSEYVRTVDGKLKLTRRMKAGQWTFTKVGHEIYERNRQTFVLEVPAIVHTTARDGVALQIKKHLATDKIDRIGRLTSSIFATNI